MHFASRSSEPWRRSPRNLAVFPLLVLLGAALLGSAGPARAQNAIVLENQLPGTPESVWDISGAGDLTIQGFATDISVNKGETIHFKIKTDADAYHIDIYRLGFYQGNGARLVGTGVITASLPQAQPADSFDAVTGLTDCGNWAESAHWDVPAGAVSGIYLAKLTRNDTQGASHIVFIVRDDASHSDMFVQASDATWQAYNNYGGTSLYMGGAPPNPLNHAAKVSYNRPFYTRNGGGGGGASEDWLFNSEYPMIRFLEANGYDVTYTTGVDTDRRGNLILNHKVWIESGHDEYWSKGMRDNVQAARDAGVNLAFFSGNEIYWKTRWEPSVDGTGTPYRTLVCYKEGPLGENQCGTKCDPMPGVWTGLWRDGCAPDFPGLDACLPENALSGNISWDGNTSNINVPDTYKNLRFWRNTAVARLGAGQTYPLPPGTLGYEWDWEQYEASYPPRRILLSNTDFDGHTHHLSLYRAPSGALVFGAGTVQWAWGLDSHHDRGNTPPDTAMQQATVNLFADMGVQPATLISGLVSAAGSTDATPPSSVITSPLDGQQLSTSHTVSITGTATDAGGGVVAGVEVSVDGGATWRAASGAASWTYLWTPTAQGTVTIESRAYDDTGNLETPGGGETPPNVAVVTVGPPVCPCTVFADAIQPAQPNENDPNAVELGMKFRSSVGGFVTGVRFFKGSTSNAGPHLGHLWATNGTRLAEVQFTGESASGWQTADFANPVAITAGTTYVISYFAPSGHYSVDVNGFASAAGGDPLTAPADTVGDPNGVFAYGSTPAYPTSTFSKSNYWVDVVFNTAVGPDSIPPTVVTVSPGNGTTGVAATTAVTATFSEAIDPATIDGTTFTLVDVSNSPVPATVTYNQLSRTAVLTPVSQLAYSSAYTAKVKGGLTDPRVKDLAGNALAADVTWSFTTGGAPPPPPTEGPGGPVLVISAAANPFGRYLAEILRTEGLNEFTAMDISLVTPAVLAQYDVVVLGEQSLSASQVTMLTDWTTAGGTLIAMRPDKQLAGFLGLTDANSVLSNKYLLVNTASGPGVGIVGQTIQFHGPADLYTLNGATSVATLYSNATTATANPAVTMKSVGTNGGLAVAFTYDLARSVVYTRQGNPAWVNQKRDGQIPPIRSDDQFFGAASFDPQPDWIDLNKVAIPQADEQQRLLANLITQGNLHRKPLPRFWYLPKQWKAAIVMTGDDHGDAGMQPRFDIYRNESNPAVPSCDTPGDSSVANWDCIRATGYEYVGSTFTDAQALFYHNLGFEVAVHILTNCANFTPAEYDSFLAQQLRGFRATFPSIPLPRTNRNHCIAWSDWSMTAEEELAYGIRLDTNYYYWPPSWVNNQAGMFGGSGMCMRFAKLDGTMVDCYQAVTEMPDESGESFPAFCDALLDKANGPEGYYGIFTTNMHFDQPNHAGSNAVVASAQAHGVPVVSAEQMLNWLDGRSGSSFGNLAWSGNQLTFSITTGTGSRNLEAMLPVLSAVGSLTGLTRNGSPVAFATQTVKGIQYAFFPATDGNYTAQYLVDTTPPVITAVSATPHADGTADVAWTTDEVSDSHVLYGTDANNLSLEASSAALVTSHAVTLNGLAANTTYFYRVRSTDGASNAATSPAPPAAPQSFAMPAAICAADRTTADFAAGTFDANVAASVVTDGEVILRPTLGDDFSGTTLGAAWSTGNGIPWQGGTVTVGAGAMTVSGAHAVSAATFGPGTSLEFVATFVADPFQNVGFSASANFDAPWMTIGTGSGGGGVYARSSANPSGDVSLGPTLLGSSHRYRIEWGATSFAFYVDGATTPAATLPATIATPMVVQVSDVNLNANPLVCAWVRVSPFATPGQFTSRVFDGGGPTSWGMVSWNATVPDSTTLALDVRTGNSPTPDGTWGAFTPVANGGTVGTSSRYLQYRASLGTTAALKRSTPSLDDVSVTCNAGADVTPPVITNVVAAPDPAGTSAIITWSTNEPATSQVAYGTSPATLDQQASSSALVTSHSVTLGGLTAGTTYDYRVTSVDAANNAATAPAPPAAPLTFNSATPPTASDVTAAQFLAGTTGTGTYVSETTNGEVILAPAEGAEFSGTALPPGWSSDVYATVGTAAARVGPTTNAVVSGGQVAVDGEHVNTTAFYGPGRTVEFVATFDPTGIKQHAGFGNTLNEPYWAIFSTGDFGGTLQARALGSSTDDFTLPAGLLGAPHRYRIAWNASSVDFYVDGALVHSAAVTITNQMRPIISDGSLDGISLRVDWMRMTPYASTGTFTSRVLDAGASTAWGAVTWSASTPTGTSLSIAARLGNTATPDASWTNYLSLAGSGNAVPGTSRYLQYQAHFTTNDAAITPELRDLEIAGAPATDASPPNITGIAATPAGDGQSTLVTWTTDEPADSRVAYGTSAGSLTLSATSSALDLTHGVTLPSLSPGATYYYRVTSVDLAGNTAISPAPPGAPLSFTTPAPACFVDATAADFGAGTLDAGAYLGDTAGGEVTLAPAAASEFDGAALPAGWESATYVTGGTATLAGGEIAVDGARANALAFFAPGRSVEFAATFDATAPGQHAGFGNTLNEELWAIFSTGATGGALLARTNNGSTQENFTLSAGLLGARHVFRITWTASSVDYYVDGSLVHTSTVPMTASMRPIVGDGAKDGTSLRVDWMRMTPYAVAGRFLSRVFAGSGLTSWGQAQWTATTPESTALAVSVRTGNTPTPDGSWSGFTALAGPGASVGAQSYYIQYRADLSTSGFTVTPTLADLTIQCAAVPDNTPPVISNVVATPAAAGTSATITWTTDEPATARVDYGTDPNSLGSSPTDASKLLSHTVTLNGLSPLTTYSYRVVSADGAGNTAMSPSPPAAPAMFTTLAPPCPVDQTLADFSAGTLDANTTTSLVADGEVILKPAFISEFDGTSIPSGWTFGNTGVWTGGTATVGSGVLTANGAHIVSPVSYPPGTSLEFVATFRADASQNIGFSGDALFNNPWVTVGTGSAGNGVYARQDAGGDISLGSGLLGSSHRYRIEWGATSFSFYVDGASTPAATITKTVSQNLFAQVSDLTNNAIALTVDWLRVGPYAGAGSFTSRVFDGSAATNWGIATWTADLPPATNLVVQFRTGGTPVPDGSWSPFGVVPNGGSVGENARYLQYRADLSTTNTGRTPALNDLAVACSPGADNVPPVIANVVATPAGDGQSATVTWTTNELADSRVDFGTTSALGSSAGSPTLTKGHSVLLSGLSPGTTYSYRVNSTDAHANPASSPVPPGVATFFAPAPTCFSEQTAADFAAGTQTSAYVSSTGDGEVILAPTSGAEFSGTSIPASWQAAAWSGGTTPTVSGGQLTLNGGHAGTVATFGPGSSIEFVATFRAEANQHIGFTADFGFNSPWALFSTFSTTNTIYARVNSPGGSTDNAIATNLIGSPHRYRIDWNATNFVFYVDGAVVSTITRTISSNMIPHASDLPAGPLTLSLDWLRVAPYAASGSYLSAVHDGGGLTNWLFANWTATTPANTSLGISVRTGNTATPDGSWSAFQPVATPGTNVGLCDRYVQYKADLSTTDPGVTPVLDAFSLACGPHVAPSPAVTSLAASYGTGNDSSGRAKVALTWSGGAAGAPTSVYRKAFGDYPLYRTSVGAVPAAPASPAAALAAGWALTGVTASGQTDLPPTRDVWHYVLFQTDACGASGAVSNRVAIPDYLLGDVSNGTTLCQGDNLVNVADLTFLGAHYGAALSGPADPLACLDVGPTSDFSTHGQPQPDGQLDFEDLVMFGLNFSHAAGPAMVAGLNGLTAANGAVVPVAAPANALSLAVPALPEVGGTFDVTVHASGAGTIQALSLDLGFDPAVVEALGVVPGALLAQQAAPSLTLSPRPGRVDLALLGAATGLAGDGELARVRFRVRAVGDPALRLARVVARDGANQAVELGASTGPVAEALPARTELGAVFPNPFRRDLSVELRLNQAAHVRLNVYDVAGRLVRTLIDGEQAAGRRTVVWDGVGRTGARLASGFYVLRFQAGRVTQTRSVWLVR